MKEEFLHYIWRYSLYDSSKLISTCGKPVKVVFPGRYNHDAGPDFLESRLYIDNVLWVGHVEIHVNAGDWYSHGHQDDPAYDPVILHVVNNPNKEVENSMGVKIPALALNISSEYYEQYKSLMSELNPIPCGSRWRDFSPVKVESAIVSMGISRMEERIESLSLSLAENRGGMKELFLQTISRGFGFGKNQNPMELLGKSIKPLWLEKHKGNLFQLESIFLGQSGFIPERNKDPYLAATRSEYNYLKQKYNMVQPLGLRWKYLRMRPGNFPPLRIAQLCSFLIEKNNIIDESLKISKTCNPDDIPISPSSYWQTHYDIGKETSGLVPTMGKSSKFLLMINCFFPLSSFYNFQKGDKEAFESWLDQLERLPPENNSVTRRWEEIGFHIPNAFYSQAFLFIYRNYCVEKKCLACKLGQLILGNFK